MTKEMIAFTLCLSWGLMNILVAATDKGTRAIIVGTIGAALLAFGVYGLVT